MELLVVGSSIIDLFLKPKDSSHTLVEEKTLTLQLGDKIPIDVTSMTLGGNGANVAVACRRLGIDTAFYTYLGNDVLAADIQEKLKKERVLLQIEKGGNNTSFSLIFELDHDRIIFSHHPTFVHGFSFSLPDIPRFIYLTSLGDEWSGAYQKVLTFCEENNISLALSPGSPQLAELNHPFFKVLQKSTLLFLNKEEANRILKKKDQQPETLLAELAKLGPNIISMTDGENGAYARDREGNMYHIPALPLNPPFEKTGAGDAYAAAFLAAYIHQYHLEDCMKQGILNSYATMQHLGAENGLLTKEEIEEKAKLKAPVAKLLT